MDGLKQAIKIAGNQTLLGKAEGESRQLISHWKRYGVPAKKAIGMSDKYDIPLSDFKLS